MEETFSALIGVGAILFWWIVLAFASRRKLGSGMSTLVLRRFVLPDDSESDVLVCIVGCKSGVMGWLMTVAGISTETTLRVSKKDILFRDASLSGSSDSLLTLKGGVASVHCAIHKPIGFIILAILFVVAGVCWYVFASDGTFGRVFRSISIGFVRRWIESIHKFSYCNPNRTKSKGARSRGLPNLQGAINHKRPVRRTGLL